MKDIKLFDQTFKVLLAVAVSVWGVYIMLILFADDQAGCAVDAFNWLFTSLIWAGGITTALPLLYGVLEVLFWPIGTEKKIAWVPGLILGTGISIFLVVAIAFAVAAARLGCQ